MRLDDGVLYTFRKVAGGYDIYAEGNWAGWSAGNLTDAKNTARDIARMRMAS